MINLLSYVNNNFRNHEFLQQNYLPDCCYKHYQISFFTRYKNRVTTKKHKNINLIFQILLIHHQIKESGLQVSFHRHSLNNSI